MSTPLSNAPTTSAKSLADLAFFSEMPSEALEKLERQCTWRKLLAGEQIIGHLDRTDDVYFVITGTVRAIIYSVSGKAVAFRDIGPGDIFGEFAAIDGQPRSASVEAVEESLVVSMSAVLFWTTLAAEPDFTRAILQHFVRQMRALTGRVFEFSTLAVNNRVHAELLRLAREGRVDGNEARVARAPTHAEIASRISTHREAVTRELNRLDDLGLIKRKGAALVITDVERLTEMVMDVTGDMSLADPDDDGL